MSDKKYLCSSVSGLFFLIILLITRKLMKLIKVKNYN